MTRLRIAFKEWAVICRALSEGRQALILRKGGISEETGLFRPEYERFWLFPTYAHQQRTGIQPHLAPLLQQAEQERPASGMVRLSAHAEVLGVYRANDLDRLLTLQDLHGWSEETVRARFAYRTPGLYVLPIRVYRLDRAVELPDIPYYAGCKSWVELEDEQEEVGQPVLSEASLAEVVDRLRRTLAPSPA